MADLLAGAIAAMLAAAFALAVWRMLRGPAAADRIVAFDMLTGVSVGFAALAAVRSGEPAYLDVALVIVLAGFVATMAMALWLGGRGPGRPQ